MPGSPDRGPVDQLEQLAQALSDLTAILERTTNAERARLRGLVHEVRAAIDGLTIHADRGPAMTSKPVALLLADLGVTKTHARPHVSNDNPFSEAHFKTLKYRPAFPKRFGSVQDARAYCHVFFPWSRYAGDPSLLC